MKRKSKFTFFELRVTFYFDLFKFFIGGVYDEKDKSFHLSLIPFFVIKFQNVRNMFLLAGIQQETSGEKVKINSINPESIEKASKEILKLGKKEVDPTFQGTSMKVNGKIDNTIVNAVSSVMPFDLKKRKINKTPKMKTKKIK